jgi:hypothetical protein
MKVLPIPQIGFLFFSKFWYKKKLVFFFVPKKFSNKIIQILL